LVALLVSGSAIAEIDTTGEQYRDIQKNVVNQLINSVPGEVYDGVTGLKRYYATDFYISGNGDLPIALERTLDSDGDAQHDFGHMRLSYTKLEINDDDSLFYPWPDSVYCNPSIPSCYPHDEDTAINRVPNACVALRHSYVSYQDPYSNNLIYKGVEFPAPRFYVGNGRFVKFLLRNPSDTRFPANASLVSRDNWYIDCVNSSTMNVYSPSGIRYQIKRQITTGTYLYQDVPGVIGPVDRYYTSEITDKFGNSLTFNEFSSNLVFGY